MPSETNPRDSARVLHEETIPFPLMQVLIWLFAIMSAVLLSLAAMQGVSGTERSVFAGTLVPGLILLAVIAILINYRKLKLAITDEAITVAYGAFRDTIPLGTVTAAYRDTASALIRYGGWGIRFGRVEGRWRKVYNVIGCQNVVVRVTGRRVGELAFASRDPEKVLFLLNRMIRKS